VEETFDSKEKEWQQRLAKAQAHTPANLQAIDANYLLQVQSRERLGPSLIERDSVFPFNFSSIFHLMCEFVELDICPCSFRLRTYIPFPPFPIYEQMQEKNSTEIIRQLNSEAVSLPLLLCLVSARVKYGASDIA
jgi:hypothetical protein